MFAQAAELTVCSVPACHPRIDGQYNSCALLCLSHITAAVRAPMLLLLLLVVVVMMFWRSRHRCRGLRRRAACSLQVVAVVVTGRRLTDHVQWRLQIFIRCSDLTLVFRLRLRRTDVQLAVALVHVVSAARGPSFVCRSPFWVGRRWWRRLLDLVHGAVTVHVRYKCAVLIVHRLSVVAVRHARTGRELRLVRHQRRQSGRRAAWWHIGKHGVRVSTVGGVRYVDSGLQVAGCQSCSAVIGGRQMMSMTSTDRRGGSGVIDVAAAYDAVNPAPDRRRRGRLGAEWAGCRRSIVALHQRVHQIRAHLRVDCLITSSTASTTRSLRPAEKLPPVEDRGQTDRVNVNATYWQPC